MKQWNGEGRRESKEMAERVQLGFCGTKVQ